jgi:hypothetical protein
MSVLRKNFVRLLLHENRATLSLKYFREFRRRCQDEHENLESSVRPETHSKPPRPASREKCGEIDRLMIWVDQLHS